MWRRSWLSREVLLFTSFSGVATLVCGGCSGSAPLAPWARLPDGADAAIGALTVALGIAGVTASACIYRVPSRPAWNTRYTLLQFNLTAALLGPLFAAAVGVGDARWLAIAAATMAGAQFVLLARALPALHRVRQPRAEGNRASALDGLGETPGAAGRPAGRRRDRAAAARGAGGALRWRWPLPRRFSAAICSSSASSRSTWPRPYIAVESEAA